MYTIQKRFKLGSRVLFIANKLAFTGTVCAITLDSYGITGITKDFWKYDYPDEIKNTIDLKTGTVFILQRYCYHTDEISDEGILRTRNLYLFDTVEDAYKQLPKKTLPFRPSVFNDRIQLIPYYNLFILKGEENNPYYYKVADDHSIVSHFILEDEKGKIKYTGFNITCDNDTLVNIEKMVGKEAYSQIYDYIKFFDRFREFNNNYILYSYDISKIYRIFKDYEGNPYLAIKNDDCDLVYDITHDPMALNDDKARTLMNIYKSKNL